MFYHFDTTNDVELNDDELDSIEHLKNEPCTDVFLHRCDQDGNGRIFPAEWCQCFHYACKSVDRIGVSTATDSV